MCDFIVVAWFSATPGCSFYYTLAFNLYFTLFSWRLIEFSPLFSKFLFQLPAGTNRRRQSSWPVLSCEFEFDDNTICAPSRIDGQLVIRV